MIFIIAVSRFLKPPEGGLTWSLVDTANHPPISLGLSTQCWKKYPRTFHARPDLVFEERLPLQVVKAGTGMQSDKKLFSIHSIPHLVT